MAAPRFTAILTSAANRALLCAAVRELGAANNVRLQQEDVANAVEFHLKLAVEAAAVSTLLSASVLVETNHAIAMRAMRDVSEAYATRGTIASGQESQEQEQVHLTRRREVGVQDRALELADERQQLRLQQAESDSEARKRTPRQLLQG